MAKQPQQQQQQQHHTPLQDTTAATIKALTDKINRLGYEILHHWITLQSACK
jgi:hypothetical protein